MEKFFHRRRNLPSDSDSAPCNHDFNPCKGDLPSCRSPHSTPFIFPVFRHFYTTDFPKKREIFKKIPTFSLKTPVPLISPYRYMKISYRPGTRSFPGAVMLY